MNIEEFDEKIRSDPLMVELRKAQAKFDAQWAAERKARQTKIKELRAIVKGLEAERHTIYCKMQQVVGEVERLLKKQIPKPLQLRTCEKAIETRKRTLTGKFQRWLISQTREHVAKAIRCRPLAPYTPPPEPPATDNTPEI